MWYAGPPSSPEIQADMSAGLLICMTTPDQGNVLPCGCWYFCDNGKFGSGWHGEGPWFSWLKRTLRRYGVERCLGAVAPDVPFVDTITLAESTPWLAPIRQLGIPAAFAAQNGSEHAGMIPWDDLDILFLAGDDAWKEGLAAADLVLEAKSRGKTVHMGRVNTRRRLVHAAAIGCDTADGTTFKFGPDKNHPDMMRWLRDLAREQPRGVQFPLFSVSRDGAA